MSARLKNSWGFSLSKPLERNARELVRSFADDVVSRSPEVLRPGFAMGSTGVAEFLYQVHGLEKKTKYSKAGGRFLQDAFTKLASAPINASNLGGWPGFLLIARANKKVVDSAIDQTLLKTVLHELSQTKLFDAANGIAGTGFYFLRQNAIQVKPEHLRSFFSRIDEIGEGRPVNLGFAHGRAGVIAFYAAMYNQTTEIRGLRKRLERLSEELAAYALESDLCPHFLSQQDSRARVAWCYGDAGVALALLRASEALKSQELNSAAQKILMRNAGRTPKEMGVRDAFICHGSSGNALIAQRFYQSTRASWAADLAEHWTKLTIEKLNRKPRVERWKKGALCNGILTSNLGAALVLTSVLRKRPADWDTMFLLSPSAGN